MLSSFNVNDHMRDSAFPLSYENSSPQNGSLFSLPPSHPPPPPLSGRYQNMPVGAGSRERTRLSRDGLHYMSQPRAAYRVQTLLSRIPNVPHNEMRGHEGSRKVIKGTPPPFLSIAMMMMMHDELMRLPIYSSNPRRLKRCAALKSPSSGVPAAPQLRGDRHRSGLAKNATLACSTGRSVGTSTWMARFPPLHRHSHCGG